MRLLDKFLLMTLLFLSASEHAFAVSEFTEFEGCAKVDDSELAQMRGGFETVSGGAPLSFAFSIERSSFVNGQLVAASTFTLPSNTSALNNGGTAGTKFDPITLIQNGTGNTFSLPNIRDMPTQVMTLIQNTLDNQVFRNVTVLNVSITSRDFLRSLALQSSLSRMVLNSTH